MGARSRDAGSDTGVSEAIDALYAAPFDRFVALRGELAARLRAAGDASGAKTIGKAIKPSRTAWALNQVARGQPALVAAVALARDAATAAQKSGDAHEIRDRTRRYREAVADAVRAVRSILEADGVSLSGAQARRVGETLQALAADDAGRETLTAGRLTHDVEVDDPFAGLDVGPPARHARADPPAREETSSRRPDERTSRQAPENARDAQNARNARAEAERLRRDRERADHERALEEARARIAALERSVAEARSAVAEASRALAAAQRRLDTAKEGLEGAVHDLGQAREHLKKELATRRA
jgi:chromosome segregation ATPase